MNDLIQRITNAIFRQEGMSPDAANPGNLRDCPWFPKDWENKRYYNPGNHQPQYVKYANGFWVPRSRAEGIAGAAHVVALHIAKGDSLTQFITLWAPASENNTEQYIANVKQWAGIPNENLPLWNYIMEPVS